MKWKVYVIDAMLDESDNWYWNDKREMDIVIDAHIDASNTDIESKLIAELRKCGYDVSDCAMKWPTDADGYVLEVCIEPDSMPIFAAICDDWV